MICSRCHRKLKSPTVISGGLTIGPTCARIMGLALQHATQKKRAVVEQAGQMALFDLSTSPVGMLA